jgi:hypothetical protein
MREHGTHINKDSNIRRGNLLAAAAFVLLPAVTALELHNQGRIWWCACGHISPWVGDIWSSHASQHLIDPYSFTHVLHGVIFCGLTWLLFRRFSLVWQLWIATLAECAWEIIENSQCIIQRYREATMSLGYEGDSIANSLGDILCCAAGFVMARFIGFRWSLVVIVVTELVLLVWIRDNLTLNILMLIHPVEAIKTWQMVH